MKGIIKKYWKSIVLFGALGVVFIPFTIHILFKISAPIEFFDATWTSGDILSFYGVIIGAVATVGGVYLSIQYSKQSSIEDTNNKVRPFLVVTPLIAEGSVDLISQLLIPKQKEPPEDYYREYVLNKVCFILNNGKTTAHSKLTSEQEEAKQKFGRRQITKEDGTLAITQSDVENLTIIVENLGVGVANRLLVAFYKEGVEKDMALMTPLKVNSSMTVELFVENPKPNDYGTYVLEFEYQDIYENTYRQCFHVELNKEKLGSCFFLWNEGQQEKIN